MGLRPSRTRPHQKRSRHPTPHPPILRENHLRILRRLLRIQNLHAGTKYEKTIWRCNRKYDGDQRCQTPHIENSELEELFLQAVKKHLTTPEDPALEAAILRALDTQELEIQAEGIAAQIDAAAKHMDTLIAHNSRTVQDQDEYERDFTQARQRHQELLTQHGELLERIQSKTDRQAAYHYYKQELNQLDAQTLEFSPYLCVTMLNQITVKHDGTINVMMTNS